MKILFIRHGQSVDDIEDRYGGAADFDLTEKGREQASEAAEKIAKLSESFEIVLSSPLKRAHQTAEIIANRLELQLEVFPYLKERNLNGVLTGLVRTEAREKYPEVVATHDKWEYVDGSEREEDFKTRVKNGIKYLLQMEYASVVAVTHGLFLKTFFKEFMGRDIKKVGDGGFVFLEEKDGEFVILKEDGVE